MCAQRGAASSAVTRLRQAEHHLFCPAQRSHLNTDLPMPLSCSGTTMASAALQGSPRESDTRLSPYPHSPRSLITLIPDISPGLPSTCPILPIPWAPDLSMPLLTSDAPTLATWTPHIIKGLAGQYSPTHGDPDTGSPET